MHRNWTFIILGGVILIMSGLINAQQQARLGNGECAIQAIYYGDTEHPLGVTCP